MAKNPNKTASWALLTTWWGQNIKFLGCVIYSEKCTWLKEIELKSGKISWTCLNSIEFDDVKLNSVVCKFNHIFFYLNVFHHTNKQNCHCNSCTWLVKTKFLCDIQDLMSISFSKRFVHGFDLLPGNGRDEKEVKKSFPTSNSEKCRLQ